MRQVREVLRLKWAIGLSERQDCPASGSVGRRSPNTCDGRRPRGSHGLPALLDEAALEQLLFPALPPSGRTHPIPDWSTVHQELKRKA